MKTEADFISALKAIAVHPAARGLADDCAVLAVGGETLVLTHDMMVEGTHYPVGGNMADVAWKLVATNLSDLAAKGAEPLGVLIGHMLGDGDEAFLSGLADALGAFDVPLLGGDTVSGKGTRSHGLTAIGRATHLPVPARSGAGVGDALYITGSLGGAMMGYEALLAGSADHARYSRPRPRLAEGRALAPLVSAMMDISDGLLLDAFRMAEASHVSIAIDSAAVPVDAAGSRRMDALTWGDDYELLFTLPVGVEPPVAASCIGQVETRGFAPLFLDGHPLTSAEGLGYSHG